MKISSQSHNENLIPQTFSLFFFSHPPNLKNTNTTIDSFKYFRYKKNSSWGYFKILNKGWYLLYPRKQNQQTIQEFGEIEIVRKERKNKFRNKTQKKKTKKKRNKKATPQDCPANLLSSSSSCNITSPNILSFYPSLFRTHTLNYY